MVRSRRQPVQQLPGSGQQPAQQLSSRAPQVSRSRALAPGRGSHAKWHMLTLPPPLQCVWTRSASGSLQSIGNVFPFTERSRFAYLENNHNSLLGGRALGWSVLGVGAGGKWHARQPQPVMGSAA